MEIGRIEEVTKLIEFEKAIEITKNSKINIINGLVYYV